MGHYDSNFITARIEAFRKHMETYDGQITVLFDADNTLFMFSHHGEDGKMLQLCHNKGFYKNLPVFQEAPSVIENLQRFGLRVGIISKYMPGYSRDEKLQSFRYHFPTIFDDDIILVPYNESKIDYVEDIQHTILVDDFHGNINEWYESGGIAIKKAYSNKRRPVPIVHSLIDTFYVLRSLGVL